MSGSGVIDCDFDGPGGICPRCGFKGWPGLGKNCKGAPRYTTPCLHQGVELRRQMCDSCQGQTQLKIFACALHGECAIGRRLPAIKCCTACGDYQGQAEAARAAMPPMVPLAPSRGVTGV